MFRDAVALVVAVAVPVVGGAIIGLFTGPGTSPWYQTIEQPPWNPPDWVFGPVWTVLYFLMGIASWLVWRKGWNAPGVQTSLGLYGGQLALNLLWPIIFFGLQSPGWALLEILALWILIIVVLVRFGRVNSAAAVLLVPYLIWVSYAATLNAGVWWLNR